MSNLSTKKELANEGRGRKPLAHLIFSSPRALTYHLALSGPAIMVNNTSSSKLNSNTSLPSGLRQLKTYMA